MKTSYLYVIRDEYHSPLSIARSKKVAQSQLLALAKYAEYNRKWKITEIRDTIIYFENFNHVDFVEIPYCGTKKDFMRHFDFVEDYSKWL